MSELSEKLYEHFKQEPQYLYSNDTSVKALEIDAIHELEALGKITIKIKTIGYVIAEIS